MLRRIIVALSAMLLCWVFGVSLAQATDLNAAYSSAVTADSPMGFWRLNQAAGSPSAANQIAGGSVLARTGGTSTFGVQGLSGTTAISFPGNTTAVLGGAPAPATDGSASVEAWIKTTDTSTGSHAVAVFATGSAGLYVSAGKLMALNWSVPSVLISDEVVADGVWHQVALVVGSGSQTLYIDGTPRKTGPWAPAGLGTSPKIVVGNGNTTDNNQRFNGTIEDVSTYNQTLTAARIQAHFNAAALCYPENFPGSQFGMTDTAFDAAIQDARDLGYTGCMIETIITGTDGIDGLPTAAVVQEPPTARDSGASTSAIGPLVAIPRTREVYIVFKNKDNEPLWKLSRVTKYWYNRFEIVKYEHKMPDSFVSLKPEGGSWEYLGHTPNTRNDGYFEWHQAGSGVTNAHGGLQAVQGYRMRKCSNTDSSHNIGLKLGVLGKEVGFDYGTSSASDGCTYYYLSVQWHFFGDGSSGPIPAGGVRATNQLDEPDTSDSDAAPAPPSSPPPGPDADLDGVLDSSDWCKYRIGVSTNHGCQPEGQTSNAALYRPDQGILNRFNVGQDGLMWDTWMSNDGAWHSLKLGGMANSGKPSAVLRANGDQHAFYRGSDNAIWDEWMDAGTSTWHNQRLGGDAASVPSAFERADNHDLHVFFKGTDGAIWDEWMDAPTSTWHTQWIGGSAATGPSAMYRTLNHDLHAFYKGTDGALWDQWMSASDNIWHNQRIGGAPADTPAALYRSDYGDLNVFFRGTNGSLFDVWMTANDNTWHSEELGGTPAGTPAPMYRPLTDDVHLFYRGTDNHIWDMWMTASDNAWHNQYIGGTAGGDPTPLNMTSNGNIEVFYPNFTGAINNVWLNGSTNVWGNQAVGGTMSFPASPAANSAAFSSSFNGDLHMFSNVAGSVSDRWMSASDSAWHVTNTGGTTTSDVGALNRRLTGHMYAFYRGSDGLLKTNWMSPPESVWHTLGVGGASAVGAPSAVERTNTGDLHSFYRGSDNAIWDAWMSASDSVWHNQRLGGTAAGSPSALFRSRTGDLHVFYQGADNAIWDMWMDAPTSTWHNLSLGGSATSAPSAFERANTGDLHAFYRGSDGAIWDQWMDAPTSTWHNQRIGGAAIAGNAPSALNRSSNGDLHVFYRGTNNAIWDIWMDAPTSTWHNQSLGGTAAGGPSAAYREDRGDLHAFYKGSDGAVWDQWMSASDNIWHNQRLG
jgi:hypothetical protein